MNPHGMDEEVVKATLLASAKALLAECGVEVKPERGVLVGPLEPPIVSLNSLINLARAVSAASRLWPARGGLVDPPLPPGERHARTDDEIPLCRPEDT